MCSAGFEADANPHKQEIYQNTNNGERTQDELANLNDSYRRKEF